MSSTPAAVPYGVITLDGIQYIERMQIFADQVTITHAKQLITNLRLTLPGVANFLLKGLTRDFTVPASAGKPPGSQDRSFRFRLSNAEGSTWFFSSGLGIFDDRVVDNLCFGSGQFPFPLIPPIPVSANGTLIYEVEDMGFTGNNDPNYFPYVIHFGFHGSYLIPVAQANDVQSIVYVVPSRKA